MQKWQPELQTTWGLRFFGEAKTDGHIWWWEEIQDDGSIRKRPLVEVKGVRVRS